MNETHTMPEFWRVKVAARLHDPAEKALVLLRDPAGHEGGSIRTLRRLADLEPAADLVESAAGSLAGATLFARGLDRRDYETVKRADRWAAAADRPQFPYRPDDRYADWAQVHWAKQPELIHPLAGDRLDLARQGGFADTDLADLKGRSVRHFARLLVKDETGEVDFRRTLLALWRFGPELVEEKDAGRLGHLWRHLPADTRIPDHSIWDHLDLASAFAGAFAAAPEGMPALLTLSIGPVQGFIEAARSTSDLWAGSHLLARLAWETMKPLVEELGPDALIFPRLRGVPQVDLWLEKECGLPMDLFTTSSAADLSRGGTDAHPLFCAALPNRFVALVPSARVEALAAECAEAGRKYMRDLGQKTVRKLLEAAEIEDRPDLYAYRQVEDQLAGFPEVHWASASFSLVPPRDPARDRDPDVSGLKAALAPFCAAKPGEKCGFIASEAWTLLSQEIKLKDGSVFYRPNPGVLYPALFDLAERALQSAKAVRVFGPYEGRGYRCSLTGEAEWLTHDPAHLERSHRQNPDTLWARVARRRPAWAKKGEHLSALPAIKRLWPTLFVEEIKGQFDKDFRRFVVSTHTMALAGQLERWFRSAAPVDPDLRAHIEAAVKDPSGVALPPRFARYAREDRERFRFARTLAALLDEAGDEEDERTAERHRRLVQKALFGREGGRLETYYALLLMDGDRMGAWVSGDPDLALKYEDTFHRQVRDELRKMNETTTELKHYIEAKRAVSPGRHIALSSALNDFSLVVARHVIEQEFHGRLIYSGGDDVLAMLPAAEILPALVRLRLAYSGVGDEDDPNDPVRTARGRLRLSRGFAWLDGRLLRLMGGKATASCGAVIAHHQTPLSVALRELRAAEKRAKDENVGDRDAFSLTVLKRAGGDLHFTGKFTDAAPLIADLRVFLAHPRVSRRAVYHTLEWLRDLPEPQTDGDTKTFQGMLAAMLGHQFARQVDKSGGAEEILSRASDLSRRLAAYAAVRKEKPLEALENLLLVAEFIARETRMAASDDETAEQEA